MLFNLLSNAINYSEPGQTVTLAAMRRMGEIVFKVSDRGRGIPPEMIDRVFDRFETFPNGSRHRGPGLGLSIVRAMVELHGGRVLIDTAPERGDDRHLHLSRRTRGRPAGRDEARSPAPRPGRPWRARPMMPDRAEDEARAEGLALRGAPTRRRR